MPRPMKGSEEGLETGGQLRLGKKNPCPHSQWANCWPAKKLQIMIIKKRRLTGAEATGKQYFGVVPKGLHAHTRM